MGPYNGQPKASGYGLRLVHASKGVTVCATCHPSNPHTVLDETSKPPYYLMRVSNLTNPCDSAQEDLPFDVDTIGLDNDGNGYIDCADYSCSHAKDVSVAQACQESLGASADESPTYSARVEYQRGQDLFVGQSGFARCRVLQLVGVRREAVIVVNQLGLGP